MKLGKFPLFSAILAGPLAVLFASQSTLAAPYTWIGDSAATLDWATSTNWAGGTVDSGPGSTSDTLTFFNDITTALANGNNLITTGVPAALTMNVLTLNGKGADATAATNVTIGTSSSTWTLGGTSPTVNLNGVNGTQALNYTITSKLTLGAATTFTGDGTASFNFSGDISGSAITKSGTSSLTLSGNNTFTGGVTISGGSLVLGSAGALNSTTPNNITVSGGTLKLNGNSITTSNLSLSSGYVQNGGATNATLTMGGGNIQNFQDGGAGKLAVVVTGFTVLNGSNTFTGGLWVKGGTIDMVGGSSFGNGSVTLGDTSGAAANVLLAGHTSGNWGNSIIVESGNTGSVTLNNFGGYSPTLSGSINLKKTFNVYNNSGNAGTRTITLSGKISGSAGLYLYASRNESRNQITLSNTTSDFTGAVTINSGVVYVNSIANGGAASSIGASTSDAANLVFDGGTLKYNGSSNTTSDRAFTINGGKTAYIDTAAYNLSFAGATGAGTTGALYKAGTGALTLTGAQTYTGLTTVADGTLKNGSATTFTSKGALTLSGTSVFDLNGFNTGFTNVSSSVATATITDNSAGTGTSTFALSAQANTISALIKDGATRKVAVSLTNSNASTTPFTVTNANTFSGGLVLLNSTSGTRLRVSAAVTTVGSAGAIVSSPFGTGPITIGQAATDKAGILLDTVNNIAIANDIVFNTTKGTDIEGFRLDTTGNVLSGKITANLADATFATGSANTGAVTLSGQVTGSQGLALRAVTTGWLTVTLNNAGTANNYTGNTSVGFGSNGRNTLVLGRADQIPNGAGKGDVSVIGTFNLGGFNETINGLSGSGSADGVSGSPTLTIGDGDATGNNFSGELKNTGGTLAVTKIGNGTQTLSGANTYTGTTTVSAGTLAIGAGGSIANSSQIIVGANTTFDVSAVSFTLGGSNTQTLSGTGAITGNMTVGTQGILAIGSSPGTMTFANDLGLNANSVSNFEINGFDFGNYDLALAATAGSQTVTFNGGTLNLLFQSGFSTNGTVKIFNFDTYQGSGFTTVAATGLASGFTASFDRTNGIVTVVPESRAALLGGLGLMVLLRRRRVA